MWPRLICADGTRRLRTTPLPQGFNVAAPDLARMVGGRPESTGWNMLQCGRADLARMASSRRSAHVPAKRFNVAAPDLARMGIGLWELSDGARASMWPRLIWRGWVFLPLGQKPGSFHASMWPRLIWRGWYGGAAHRQHDGLASMWPRLIWRGWSNKLGRKRTNATLQCGRADLARMVQLDGAVSLSASFNVAAPDLARMVGSDGKVRVKLNSLQCGRADLARMDKAHSGQYIPSFASMWPRPDLARMENAAPLQPAVAPASMWPRLIWRGWQALRLPKDSEDSASMWPRLIWRGWIRNPLHGVGKKGASMWPRLIWRGWVSMSIPVTLVYT